MGFIGQFLDKAKLKNRCQWKIYSSWCQYHVLPELSPSSLLFSFFLCSLFLRHLVSPPICHPDAVLCLHHPGYVHLLWWSNFLAPTPWKLRVPTNNCLAVKILWHLKLAETSEELAKISLNFFQLLLSAASMTFLFFTTFLILSVQTPSSTLPGTI